VVYGGRAGIVCLFRIAIPVSMWQWTVFVDCVIIKYSGFNAM
jgi:hypothetical protein